MLIVQERFLVKHALYPVIILAISSITITYFDVDKLFADYLYSMQDHHWSLKNSWLLETVIHKGGRTLSILIAVIFIISFIASFFSKRIFPHRKQLMYLLLAVAGSSIIVNILKSSLATSCPWEFERYGGTLPYNTVIEQLFLRNGEGCFPAGHASAGYIWVALYFFALCYRLEFRWVGLLIPIAIGVMFGLAQQIRGAHFISHDIWTLAICWFFSMGLYFYMFSMAIVKLHIAPIPRSASVSIERQIIRTLIPKD